MKEKIITIRHVPVELHKAIHIAAINAGQTLNTYLLALLSKMAK